MKTLLFFSTALGCASAVLAQTPTIPPAAIQIKTAVLAAPVNKRDSATVYGYSPKNEFVLLRQGTNELVCLADDPAQKGLNVACYHKDLDPFMARGRALKKEGKKADEILKIREEEVKGKILLMPEHPSTLFVYRAKDENYNAKTGDVKDGYLRYVVYIPYATAESTGLPTKPEGPGMPWLMDAGTHRAHIMINPPESSSDHH
ncbi:hypothetical protein WBJ53_04355 [Spirosoma sp. SC4-14]|uniref:hypothetical protein n=1 Tax=Spirosoma sp. SC4-14 TaxID=3128900 RepID=UPI0030CFBA9F